MHAHIPIAQPGIQAIVFLNHHAGDASLRNRAVALATGLPYCMYNITTRMGKRKRKKKKKKNQGREKSKYEKPLKYEELDKDTHLFQSLSQRQPGRT